jgi:hypothetical protein
VGAQASIDLIYEAAENKDKPAALRGLEALKSRCSLALLVQKYLLTGTKVQILTREELNRANSFVRLANQRMPDDTIPLSEIK